MYYVLGLGNPEKKYDGTRHNVGFEIVDSLREMGEFNLWQDDKYARAKRATGLFEGQGLELLQPQTYMNNSGETAYYLVEKEGVKAADIIVIYDDVDLPIGELKVTVGRGAGGHNGVQSIIDQIGKDFIRIRVGVAKKNLLTRKVSRPSGHGMSQHVLGKFSFFERSPLRAVTAQAQQAITLIVQGGVEKAMNECNQ